LHPVNSEVTDAKKLIDGLHSFCDDARAEIFA
jgi:hypothetical protein